MACRLFMLVALLLTCLNARAEDHLNLSLSLDYSSGRYGTPTHTGIWYVPLEAEYVRDRFVGKLSIPFLSISNTGAGKLVTGGRNPTLVNRPPARPVVNTSSGIGDVLLSLGYRAIWDFESNWYITPTGIVKLGTADESRGLGTGENDYSLQLDFARVMQDWTAFGHAGYTFVGDPAGLNLNNTAYGRIGIDYAWADKESVGAYFDLKERASAGIAGRAEATVYYIAPLDEHTKGSVFLRAGFTSSVPDWGGGISLTYSAF